MDPNRIDWRHGFFVRSLPARRPLDAIAHFEDWYAGTALPSNFAGVAGIFHVSRCGSTLLAQNLKATGRAVVLSEPPFMRILRTRFDYTLDAREAAEFAVRAIGQWRDWAAAQGKLLVIKFNSQTHEWRELLQDALPGARFAFLHREPAPVLESISRGPPQYLQRNMAQRRQRGQAELDVFDENPVLLAAARRYCAALDAFRDVDEWALPIAYTDLADRFASLCAHLGIATDGPVAWNAAIDAKSHRPGSDEPYRPVHPDRIAKFAKKHQDLLAIVESRYQSFLEAGDVREESGREAAQ